MWSSLWLPWGLQTTPSALNEQNSPQTCWGCSVAATEQPSPKPRDPGDPASRVGGQPGCVQQRPEAAGAESRAGSPAPSGGSQPQARPCMQLAPSQVQICVCVCVCTHSACTCVGTCICVCTSISVCVYASMCVDVLACVQACVCVHTRLWVYKRLCVNIYLLV